MYWHTVPPTCARRLVCKHLGIYLCHLGFTYITWATHAGARDWCARPRLRALRHHATGCVSCMCLLVCVLYVDTGCVSRGRGKGSPYTTTAQSIKTAVSVSGGIPKISRQHRQRCPDNTVCRLRSTDTCDNTTCDQCPAQQLVHSHLRVDWVVSE
jgi:hypothetical protein